MKSFLRAGQQDRNAAFCEGSRTIAGLYSRGQLGKRDTERLLHHLVAAKLSGELVELVDRRLTGALIDRRQR
jgi:hypothetical protein